MFADTGLRHTPKTTGNIIAAKGRAILKLQFHAETQNLTAGCAALQRRGVLQIKTQLWLTAVAAILILVPNLLALLMQDGANLT